VLAYVLFLVMQCYTCTIETYRHGSVIVWLWYVDLNIQSVIYYILYLINYWLQSNYLEIQLYTEPSSEVFYSLYIAILLRKKLLGYSIFNLGIEWVMPRLGHCSSSSKSPS